MSSLQRLVGQLAVLVVLVLLVGLLRRRLYRVCVTFVLYLFAVCLGGTLILLWPQRFYNWTFWNIKEAVYGLLKFAVAVELASFTFRAFPGARATARRVMALAVVLIVAGLLVLDLAGADAAKLAMEIHPRLANGTAILFACVWALVLWYNLPVHPFHRALLRGFVFYLLVVTFTLRLVAVWGWDVRAAAGLADSLAYLLMLVYWTSVVWRPASPPPADPELVHRLQPWRDTL